jgi:hypothetical protein
VTLAVPHRRHRRNGVPFLVAGCAECDVIRTAKAKAVAERPPVESDAVAETVIDAAVTVAEPKPRKPRSVKVKVTPAAPVEVPAGIVTDIEPTLDGAVVTIAPAPIVVEPAREGETREEWMLRAVTAMRPWFPEDAPVPPIRVSIGWPAGRGSSRYIGQCFYTVEDSVPALFVSPALSEADDILETLLHEMVHAATPGNGHKGKFITVAKGLGFRKPWRSTPCDETLFERIGELAAALGPFPHSKVIKGSATRPDVQSTRMLKVICDECGYTVRTTRKWLDIGMPQCPDGDAMHEEV